MRTFNTSGPIAVAAGHLRTPLLAAALALVAVTALVLVQPNAAHAEPEWSNVSVRTESPTEVTFRVRVNAPDGLDAAIAHYRVANPDGAIGGSVRADVPPGREMDLSATLATISANRFIPVGSLFTFWWEFETADGERVTTDEEEFVLLDGRYDWQSLTDEDEAITVFYYGDQRQRAEAALQATREALIEVGELLEVEMPYPVRLVIWRNTSESRAAQRPRGTFSDHVITGGARVAPDLIHVYDELSDFVDVTMHETAHLVTRVAGFGAFTRIPSWLDEGVAVWAQRRPGSGYEFGVQQAIAQDRTMRLRAMASSSNVPGEVNAFYGQSWHVVNFMIEELGQEQFAELFRVVKGGEPIDAALEEVYGFDQDGLYNLWREHVGLDPIEFEERTGVADRPTSDATRPPLGIPSGGRSGGGQAAPADDPAPEQPATGDETAIFGDDGAIPTAGIVVLAVTLLLAGALGGIGYRLLRSTR